MLTQLADRTRGKQQKYNKRVTDGHLEEVTLRADQSHEAVDGCQTLQCGTTLKHKHIIHPTETGQC